MAEAAEAASATSDAAVEQTDASLLSQTDKPADIKPADVKPEAKPEGKDTKAADQTDKSDEKPPEVPEKYELKLPEGTIVDEPTMGEFTTWAKQLKLTNEQAQKAADLHMKVLGTFAQKQAQEFQAQQQEWVKEFTDDKDLGGGKADETLTIARKGLNALGATDRLKSELDRTGLGNHPDLIRIFHAIGKYVGDDGVIIGKPPVTGPKDMVEAWYGTSNGQK